MSGRQVSRRCSSRRPDSRKNTNIVTESYQTSRPSGPCGSKVAALLAQKAIRMPAETGTSMPMRPPRRSRRAAEKKGRQENSSTGSVSTSVSVLRLALGGPKESTRLEHNPDSSPWRPTGP